MAGWPATVSAARRCCATWTCSWPRRTQVRLGDLVAITGIDARYNLGYRRGGVTVGIVVHGSSPLAGHGPGVTVIATGPAELLRAVPEPASHAGLTATALGLQ